MEAYYEIRKNIKSSKKEENNSENLNKYINHNKDIKEDFIYIDYKELEKNKENYREHKFFFSVIKHLDGLPESMSFRIIQIIKVLDSSNIDLDKLKKLSYNGLDESSSLRSIVWKILLGLLPLNIDKWQETLDKKRDDYTKMKDKFIKNNNSLIKKKPKSNSIVDINKRVKEKNFHPLENNKEVSIKTKNYDLEIYEEISKDTNRTRTYMNLFSVKSNNVLENDDVNNNSDEENDKDTQFIGSTAITNILFIFTKCQTLKYYQGMNEILAPLIYCFYLDKNQYFSKNLEADVFYCFQEIMKHLELWFVDNYINVPNKIREFEKLLQQRDEAVYNAIKKNNIDFNFFLFRWCSLCFSQEYEIPEILRIWDSAFSSGKNLSDFFMYYSLAILKLNHEKIVRYEMTQIMILVQEEIRNLDVEKVIKYSSMIDQ